MFLQIGRWHSSRALLLEETKSTDRKGGHQTAKRNDTQKIVTTILVSSSVDKRILIVVPLINYSIFRNTLNTPYITILKISVFLCGLLVRFNPARGLVYATQYSNLMYL